MNDQGISPEDSERLLVKPLEANLRSIEGIKTMTGHAREGGGSVVLEFNADFNKQKALEDVRAQVDATRPRLPQEADPPGVWEANTSSFPVITVALSGDLPERTLIRLARNLRDELKTIPSVLEADLSGARDELLEITIDPAKLESYGITQNEIFNLESGGKYENCIFDKLDINGKELQDCIFKQCSFTDCDLTGTKFNGTSFKICNLSNANITGCNFFSASFIECKLLALNFTKANFLIGTTFTKCNFDFANLRGIDLSGLDLTDSSFIETDLSLANLEKTIFVNSYISNIKLDGAKLMLTDFRGAQLQGISLKKDNLKGAIFTPKQLEMLASETGIHVFEGSRGIDN